MTDLAPINLLYFCDGPRVFHVRHNGRHFLIYCRFDDRGDDYVDEYAVYLLPPGVRDDDFAVRPGESARAFHERWVGMAASWLGTIPFDMSRFEGSYWYVDAAFLDEAARLEDRP